MEANEKSEALKPGDLVVKVQVPLQHHTKDKYIFDTGDIGTVEIISHSNMAHVRSHFDGLLYYCNIDGLAPFKYRTTK